MLSDFTQDQEEFTEILKVFNDLAPQLTRDEALMINSAMIRGMSLFGGSPSDLPVLPIDYLRGNDTSIVTSQKTLSGFFALVNLADLIPSHNPKNFSPNPKYPAKCQQRDYSNDPREQYKVTEGAKNFNEAFLLADAPTATDGAPIVTPQGFVLGGNGRTMMMQLLTDSKFSNYGRVLLTVKSKFGFTSDAIVKFGSGKIPEGTKLVVVRMVNVDMNDCATYSNILNTNLTQSVDITTKTVSYARQLTTNDIDTIADVLAAYEGETLASILSTPKIVKKIYDVFTRAGIITQATHADWMDNPSEFTSVGKKTVEGVLLGVILPDKKLIESARSFTEKFVKTLPLLLRMQRLGADWDMTESLIRVIYLESARRSASSTIAPVSIDIYLNQLTFDRPDVNKTEEFLWRVISENSWLKWKRFIETYVGFGEQALHDKEQGGNMFGDSPLTPEQALARLSAKGLSDMLADFNDDAAAFLEILEMYKGIAPLLTDDEIDQLNAAMTLGMTVWGVTADLPTKGTAAPEPTKSEATRGEAPPQLPQPAIGRNALTPPKFTVEEYAEIVYPELLETAVKGIEKTYNDTLAEIEALETPPETWTSTAIKWRLSQATKRLTLTDARDLKKKVLTRLKNNKLEQDKTADPKVEKVLSRLRDKFYADSRQMWATTDGIPTPEQMAKYIKRLEDTSFEAVKGMDYFPTPFDVVARMIEKANISSYQKVLEPSAGKGDIADALRALNLDLTIDTVELAPHNRKILALKGYSLVGDDFLNYGVTGKDAKGFSIIDPNIQYDRIVMNPPFHGGMDWVHILHAMKLLKPQGELVAIVPAGSYLSTSQEGIERRVMIEETNLGSIEVIRAADYNKNLQFSSLSIDLAIITMTKTVTRQASLSPALDFGEDSKYQQLPKHGTEILPERTMEHIDTGFVKPKTVMAQADLVPAESSIEDYVSRIQSPRPLHLFDYQRFGCNLAIKALCYGNTGNGFLLADGTGAGKTIEMLTIAAYAYQTYKKPVVIFTVDDRVMKSSFMKDAAKLGFYVPEYQPQENIKPVSRPANYKGLYDKVTSDPAPVTAPNVLPTVYIGQKNTFKLYDGINIFKYNQLSDIELPPHVTAQVSKATKDLKASTAFWDKIQAAGNNAIASKDNIALTALGGVIGYIDILEKGWVTKAQDDWKTHVEAARLDDTFVLHQKFATACQHRDKNDDDLILPDVELAGLAFMAVVEIRNDAIKAVLGGVIDNTSLVIFDEAHKIKNLLTNDDIQASRAYYAKFITDSCARVLFATATPNDRPYDILYLKRCGIFENDKDFEWKMASLGIEYIEPKTDSQGRVVRQGRWSIKSGDDDQQREITNFRMGQFFKYIVRQGCMIRREIQYTNLEVRFEDVVVSEDVKEELNAITLACTTINSRGKPQVNKLKKMQRHLEHMEAYKIESAIRIAQEEIAEGRSVLIFTNYVDEGDKPRAEDASVKLGTVRILKNRLSKLYGEDAVGVLVSADAGYEDYRRLQNVHDFQTGKKRILIGTINSGGTGVNLDDTTGNAPRTVIIMTAPLSFINVMQGIGRVVRANSASRSRVQFLFCKTDEIKHDINGKVEATSGSIPIERWLKRLIGYKFKTLKAAVEGEIGTIDPTTAYNMEAGGADAVAYGADEDGGEALPRMHSMYTQTKKEVNGAALPSRLPLTVKRYGNVREHFVIIKGNTRDDFNNWVQANQEFIKKWGLIRNVDKDFQKWNGNHFGLEFRHKDQKNWIESSDVWNALLNQVKQEDAKYLSTSTAILAVGDEVAATTDITQVHARTGERGTILGVQQVSIGQNENGFIFAYEYDVQFPNGKAHGVRSWQIISTTEYVIEPKYKVGQVFVEIDEDDIYNIDYAIITKVHTDNDNATYDLYHEWRANREDFLRALQSPPSRTTINGLSEDYLDNFISRNKLTEYDPTTPIMAHDRYGYPIKGEAPLSDQFTAPRPDEEEVTATFTTITKEEQRAKPSAIMLTPADLGFYDHASIMNIRPSYIRLNRTVPLLEKLAKPFRMLVWGKQGSGKSSLTLMLAEDMSLNGKVLHLLTEEKITSGRIGERVKRLNINARKIMFNDQLDYSRLREFLTKNSSINYVIVDSINQLQGASEQLLMDLWNEFPAVSFVFVGQSTKDGKNHSAFPTLAFNVDTVVKVEELVASAEKHRDGRSGVSMDLCFKNS